MLQKGQIAWQSLTHVITLLNTWGATARDAVPVLTDILRNDPDIEVRKAAAGAIGMIGPTPDQGRTVLALLNSLRSES
jgi:HEAT repeat protein